MRLLSFLVLVLLLQATQPTQNPYIKQKQRSHQTTTHKKPVPPNQLLPPITAKKKPKPKERVIIDEYGNEKIILEIPNQGATTSTQENQKIQEAKYYCLENGGAWCWKLGMYFYEGQITEQNYGEAYKAFEAGCLTKNGGACYSLGFMYEFGRGEVPQDDKKALELYLKSCNYGYNRGCQAYRALRK